MTQAPKFEWPQGSPLFEVQWRAITESLIGNGVSGQDDFLVTATSEPLQIQVDPGEAQYGNTTASTSNAETHTLSAGATNNDRWDLVYFNVSDQTSGVREGDAQRNPLATDIQDNEILLALVYVTQSANDVSDDDILNWRASYQDIPEPQTNDQPVIDPLTEIRATQSGVITSSDQAILVSDHLSDGSTIEIRKAIHHLSNGDPAPTDLDLSIMTLGGGGSFTSRQDIHVGDGSTMYDGRSNSTGSPLVSWTNNTGSGVTIAIIANNQTSSEQDTMSSVYGVKQ